MERINRGQVSPANRRIPRQCINFYWSSPPFPSLDVPSHNDLLVGQGVAYGAFPTVAPSPAHRIQSPPEDKLANP